MHWARGNCCGDLVFDKGQFRASNTFVVVAIVQEDCTKITNDVDNKEYCALFRLLDYANVSGHALTEEDLVYHCQVGSVGIAFNRMPLSRLL